MDRRNVAIMLFNDVETLDFSGPLEVFSVTDRLHSNQIFNVYTVSETPEPIITRNGLKVIPDYSIFDCPKVDILIIPGGYGTRVEIYNGILINWIKDIAADAELVFSVCTGALLLGKSGLLDGLETTTHLQAMDLLKNIAPKAKVIHKDFIDNGKIILSGGIAKGIDTALYIVARLIGQSYAEKTATHMAYEWKSKE